MKGKPCSKTADMRREIHSRLQRGPRTWKQLQFVCGIDAPEREEQRTAVAKFASAFASLDREGWIEREGGYYRAKGA